MLTYLKWGDRWHSQASNPYHGYNNCFSFIGLALLLSGVAIIFFEKVRPGSGAAAHSVSRFKLPLHD